MPSTLWRLVALPLLLVLVMLSGATAASAQETTAKLIYEDSTSQTWQGTCSRADRYFGTARIYLKKRTGVRPENGMWYSWDAPLVTLSLGDSRSSREGRGTVYLRNHRVDGSGFDAVGNTDVARIIDTGQGGQTTINTRTSEPWRWFGGMAAKWWYNYGSRTWFYDIYRIAFDVNGDSNGSQIFRSDCSVMFTYGYPFYAPSTERPKRYAAP